MPSAADRIDFNPPHDKGAIRAFGMAMLVHALLIVALTWGVNWKRSDLSPPFEAELWSSLPMRSAPAPLVAPPPTPSLAAEPRPKEPAAQRAPTVPNVDIALEKEKQRQLLKEKKNAEELAKKEKQAELKAEEKETRRLAAIDAKKLSDKKQTIQLEAEKQLEATINKQRQEALNRMMGLAGATGPANATGSAQKSSGPSASYGAKIKARVKPNIIFTEMIEGNPSAEVEVRSGLDGTIMSQRLVKPSGNKAWDDAVIKAIIRTDSMPRDLDGRVPPVMIIEFRPKD